jgi:hypothetical protein
MGDSVFIIQRTDYRDAFNAAEKALAACGMSLGAMQAGDPAGIMFGDWSIQKWRNLRQHHRRDLHGVLTGARGSNTMTITIRGDAIASVKGLREAVDALRVLLLTSDANRRGEHHDAA